MSNYSTILDFQPRQRLTRHQKVGVWGAVLIIAAFLLVAAIQTATASPAEKAQKAMDECITYEWDHHNVGAELYTGAYDEHIDACLHGEVAK